MKSNLTLSDLGLQCWGPQIVDDNRLRSDRAVQLLAERLDIPTDQVADVLLEQPLGCRYLRLHSLARTRDATVFRALDLSLACFVAIKVYDDRDPEIPYRALAEARVLARFTHPNIVRIFDVGEHDGRTYTVMELCDGDLDQHREGQPWQRVLGWILEAGQGLSAMHAAGLVHADVKPANILLDRGRAKIE